MDALTIDDWELLSLATEGDWALCQFRNHLSADADETTAWQRAAISLERLIHRGLIRLEEGHIIGGLRTALAQDEAVPRLYEESSWEPPARDDDSTLLIAATEEGERFYFDAANVPENVKKNWQDQAEKWRRR